MLKLTNEQELLNSLNPDWVDHHRKKRKTFCFHTNLGTLEISLTCYEQLDIDILKDDTSIQFIFEKHQLDASFF